MYSVRVRVSTQFVLNICVQVSMQTRETANGWHVAVVFLGRTLCVSLSRRARESRVGWRLRGEGPGESGLSCLGLTEKSWSDSCECAPLHHCLLLYRGLSGSLMFNLFLPETELKPRFKTKRKISWQKQTIINVLKGTTALKLLT